MAGIDGSEVRISWMQSESRQFDPLYRQEGEADTKIVMSILHGTQEHRAICQQEGSMSALTTQVGGNHYSTMKIQPIEYIHANGLGFIEGSVVKYVSRWKSKNGLEDLRKARHLLALLIEMEERNASS